MSPGVVSPRKVTVGFPRVSGDEPVGRSGFRWVA